MDPDQNHFSYEARSLSIFFLSFHIVLVPTSWYTCFKHEPTCPSQYHFIFGTGSRQDVSANSSKSGDLSIAFDLVSYNY